MALLSALVMVLIASAAADATVGKASVGKNREASLLQTWNKALDRTDETPITRVVNLLKEMQETLKKEMDEDEELYEKAACWCDNSEYDSKEKIAAMVKEIEELEALIEQLTAKIAELKTTIAETTEKLEADKAELAEATALRQKQLKAFHGEELDAIQNVENLKAAIIVLGKHHGGAFPQLSLSLLGVNVKNSKAAHLSKKRTPQEERQLEAFMANNGYHGNADMVKESDQMVQKFLHEKDSTQVQPAALPQVSGWTDHDKNVVERALSSGNAFLQAKGRSTYTPAYHAQSGEILGILKQMKEEMEADLSEAQKEESARVAAFEELRAAKTDEIAAGEKKLEEKKEELAQAEFDVANAKEDLERVKAELEETQKFLAELQTNCENLDKNFELRKKNRLAEIQAVSETIQILTSDEARDTFNGAYASFLQMSMRVRRMSGKQARAANVLRNAAKKSNLPELSILASKVELDAFTKVKKMIDDMIVMLKKQQEDEVAKKDWCDSEFQENTMDTLKAEDLSKDQAQKIEDLGTLILTLTEEITTAKKNIADLQMAEQRANELRVKENKDFQKTVADQVATQEILAKALERMAVFYDKLFLVQKGAKSHAVHTNAADSHAQKKQRPPMPEMKYEASAGASGVMSMIEKLIYDAKELEADSIKAENEAQTAYETMITDTNTQVAELQKAVVTKTEQKAMAEKEKVETEEGLAATMKELEELARYKATLHTDCDYLLKNFMIRQDGRAAEIEALQQAKQILSGAQ